MAIAVIRPAQAAWLLAIAVAAWLPPPSASAADNLFEVREVKVDETDQTAAAAREKALAVGERRAWDVLVDRFVDPQQRRPLPEFSQREIGDAVQDFWISEEKTSPVRYIATLNYTFRPDRVSRLLASRNIRFSTTPSPPVLVVPVYETEAGRRLWDDPNPWRDAWRSVPSRPLLPLRGAAGDLSDLATVTADQAAVGEQEPLLELAKRHGASDAVVALAAVTPRPQGEGRQLKVSAVRYGAGGAQPLGERTYPFDGEPGGDLFKQAAAGVVAELDAAWRRGTSVSARPSSRTTVQVPMHSLEEWIGLRRRLESVPQVERVRLLSISREEADVIIVYPGSTEQLGAALQQQGLYLHPGEGGALVLSTEPPPAAQPAMPQDDLFVQ